MTAALRIVVAEDSLLVREGVRRLLDRQPDLEVVAGCGDLPQLLALVEEFLPDVVVTDVRMPPTGTDEGVRAAVRLRTTHPSVGVVVLSQYAEPAYATPLLAGGAAGRAYLLKQRISEPGQLADAVRTVARGGSQIDPEVVSALVADSPLSGLSPRERQVLAGIAEGKSNAAVAAALFLSERAVEKHINALFGKLGLTAEPESNRRVRAVLLYLAAQEGVQGGR